MDFQVFALIAWITVLQAKTTQQLECLRCSGVRNVADCRSTRVSCGADEECFLEKVTTDTLEVAYNAGCRNKQVCSIMKLLGQSSGKRDLVNCADCCDTHSSGDPCNANLCSVHPPDTSVPQCLSCDHPVASVTACSSRLVCQDTEVCSNSVVVYGGLLRYKYGCEEKHLCKALAQAQAGHGGPTFKKRQSGLTLCSACCVGHDCNQEDCFTLRKQMNASMFV